MVKSAEFHQTFSKFQAGRAELDEFRIIEPGVRFPNKNWMFYPKIFKIFYGIRQEISC